MKLIELLFFRPVVGIPAFWLTAFKNVQMISEMIQPCDEPILQHLIDVRTELLEKDPMVRIRPVFVTFH